MWLREEIYLVFTRTWLCFQQEHRTCSQQVRHTHRPNHFHRRMILSPVHHAHDCHCTWKSLNEWGHEGNLETYNLMGKKKDIKPCNHIWHSWCNRLHLSCELVPLWYVSICICYVSNVKNYVYIVQFLDQLICGVEWTWLVVIVLVWTITLSLQRWTKQSQLLMRRYIIEHTQHNY